MIWNDGVLVTPGRADRRDHLVRGMRVWPPERSKLGAFCYLGGDPGFIPGMKVLYLGAAAGTTVSYLADYVEVVYAVEFAADPFRQLIRLAERRTNIIPFLADARSPEQYDIFIEPVDLICQDIAQRDQAAILIRNLHLLVPGGRFILMLKVRSISATATREEVVSGVTDILAGCGVPDITTTILEPYYPQHVAISGVVSPGGVKP